MPTQQDEIINRLDVAFRGYSTKPSDCLSFEVSSETFYIEDNKVLGFVDLSMTLILILMFIVRLKLKI